MKSETMSLDQIKKVGLEALVQALGETGMVRFIQQFELGKGDYTKERQHWLREKNVRDIVKGIEKERDL